MAGLLCPDGRFWFYRVRSNFWFHYLLPTISFNIFKTSRRMSLGSFDISKTEYPALHFRVCETFQLLHKSAYFSNVLISLHFKNIRKFLTKIHKKKLTIILVLFFEEGGTSKKTLIFFGFGPLM